MIAALEVRGLTVRLGRADVVRAVDLLLRRGTVTGLIGGNGAGKTTMLDAISGFVPPRAGRIALGGIPVEHLPAHRRARLGLGRTFQSQELFEDLTVGENLQVAGAGGHAGGARVGDHGGGARAGDHGNDDRLPGVLSHAERSRLAVDRALAGRPSVLLLDEPAAGLDDRARAALAARLRAVATTGTAVLLVDHDMRLVLDVCDRVVVLDAGRVIAEGPPAEVRDDPRVVAGYLAAAPGGRRGATLARVAPGATLVEARGLTAGYLGVPVVRDVALAVRAGEVVALLGPNGAGKTTTMLALAGVLPRMGGDVDVLGEHGGRHPDRLARLGMACVRQGQAPFPGLTVAEHLRLVARRGGGGGNDAALDRLGALRPLLGRAATSLSGGEQRMLALGLALARRPKLLLVDELSMGLAPRVVEGLLRTVDDVARHDGVGVLLVEQHPGLALGLADRGYLLERGRVTADGSAAELARRSTTTGLLAL